MQQEPQLESKHELVNPCLDSGVFGRQMDGSIKSLHRKGLGNLSTHVQADEVIWGWGEACSVDSLTYATQVSPLRNSCWDLSVGTGVGWWAGTGNWVGIRQCLEGGQQGNMSWTKAITGTSPLPCAWNVRSAWPPLTRSSPRKEPWDGNVVLRPSRESRLS